MMGQKYYVTLKMHRQLYKEHLGLQKSFCALYRHMSVNNNAKDPLNWIQEKCRLEATIKSYKAKNQQLSRKLDDANERCELLEFCLLELENQAKVCSYEDFVDKSVSTEDSDLKEWERNILNNCHDCSHTFQKIMNSELLESEAKDSGQKAEMEKEEYRLQLEESQKKLSDMTAQMDNVLQCNCKLGVGMDYVIATVHELQSLMEWTAEKKEAKADDTVIFQKLQQLERIQKDLEKTATESEIIRTRAEKERSESLSFENPHESGNGQTIDLNCNNAADDPMALLDNCVKKIELLSSSKSAHTFEVALDENGSPLLIDLNTPESEDLKIVNPSEQTKNDSHDSLGPNISEDEGLGEESRRGDSTGPSSFIELQDSTSDITRLNEELPCSNGSQITVIDPEGHQHVPEWIGDIKDEASSLDLCLCAIGNLRESLRSKENELLKLSGIQNDQKEIAALQEVIVNFHRDTAILKSELEKTKKENASLKEQVLELEEAENDSRLQAQKLGEKLVFLQEKDNHFQAKFYDTQQALEKSHEDLKGKEQQETELRSQMKYMETLVHKYEDQIKTMEIVEIALRKKLIEEDELRAIEKAKVESHPQMVEKGTQVYEPPSRSPFREIFNQKYDNISSKGSLCERSVSPICSVQNVDVCVQVPETIISHTDSYIQTEIVPNEQYANQIGCNGNVEIYQSTPILTVPDDFKDTSHSAVSSIECPIQKELLKRLHQLVEEDAHLQQQLHHVDQINLSLWKKLHNLEFHIGECRKKNIAEDGASDSCFESECDFLSSRPVSREQMRDDSNVTSKCPSPITNRGIIACLDQSEHEIKERLSTLEQINSSFEKELELREKLYIEKERKYGEWVQTEQRFIGDLKRLSDERESLINQVSQLQKEKQDLGSRVLELQSEIERATENHRIETEKIKAEQAAITSELQQKVDSLLSKEKEHLKQITNLKLERSKSSGDKSESDKLKSSYVELQLELSRTRDDMRKKEEEFRLRLDDSRSKHVMEEARLVSELEMLRSKNSSCDELLRSFQERQSELLSLVSGKERALEEAREEYRRSMQATEAEHRAVEAELKSQLRQMEEGTSVATRALTEERVRLERGLQENIDDLRSKEEVYKARIHELESDVSHLHSELQRLTAGALEAGISSFRRERLLGQLRELRDREVELREKLDEAEQKEAAYRETLEHADRIVAQVEQGYQRKIEELEVSERGLRLRVGQLERQESRLLRERLSADGRLQAELREVEAREQAVKEQLQEAEQAQRALAAKIKDLEKVRERQESELSDKEALASNLEKTQQELETARKYLSKLKKSEDDLKASLQQSEHILASTESQLKNRMRVIEEEKKGLEETISELRAQVRDLKRKLENISYEQEEKRISTSIPSKPISHACIPPTSTETDEPDYADVDECLPQPVTLKSSQQNPRGTAINMNQRSNTLPGNLPSQMSRKNTSKDKHIQQTSIPHNPDSYDTARQNLENCMLRAMAAMKSDMQKKKLARKERDNRMKMLLFENSNNSSDMQVTNEQEDEENDYDEVLPRPTNFRVVQQVGSDTLLVGWNYVNASILEGYEVYLDGHLHETVYTPDRTKALISGLNLKRPLRLSICALSRYGQMSEPTLLDVAVEEGSNGAHLHDEDDDDDSLYEDSMYEKKRPYSMEW